MKRFLALALISFAAACSSGGGDDGPDLIDGGGDDQPDAADNPGTCFAPDTFGAATIGNQIAESNGAAATPDFTAGSGTLNAAEPFDVFQLEFYKVGVLAANIVPGTYQITGQELNYATCAVCPRVFTDCTTEACEDQQFYATGGTVTLTQVSPNLVYSVSNITLVEVTVDPGTFESTPVPGGCSTTITSASFDATVTNTP
jgi:hypothetical protein